MNCHTMKKIQFKKQLKACWIIIIQMIGNFSSIEAHGRCELTSLKILQSSKIVSIGNDSCVKIWDCRNFQVQNSIKLKQAYLSSLAILSNQIIIGNGNGELMFLHADTLTINKTLKVHKDSINDIKIYQDRVVTVSSDGSMAIINSGSDHVERVIEVGSPLRHIEHFKNSYYLAGVKSFEVGSDFKLNKNSQVNRYLSTLGELYGTNDEKGFFCVSKKFNTYIPCQNMIEFNGRILGVSWSALSLFTTYSNDDRISYVSARLSEFKKGDSILSLATMGKRIFAGSECGNIYTFTVNPDYHWYEI